MRFLLLLMLTITASLGMTGCDGGEMSSSNRSIYEPAAPVFDPQATQFSIRTTIEPTLIRTTGLRRFIERVLGWVPIAADLAEMPLNLFRAMLPNLPASEVIKLPEGLSITDPLVLNSLSFVNVQGVYLWVQADLPGNKHADKKCFGFLKCDPQDLRFIKVMKVVLEEKAHPENQLVLAEGSRDINMSPDKMFIELRGQESVDLVPYLPRLEEFEIKTIVRGRPPKSPFVLEGAVMIRVGLKVLAEN